MTTSARHDVLERLRKARSATLPDHMDEVLPVDLVADSSPASLEARFIQEAEAVGVRIHIPADIEKALALLETLISDSQPILGWHPEHIPLPGLEDWLRSNEIKLAQSADEKALCGITGVNAALATTGSLVLLSGAGKPRAASLLPETHIAVVKRRQIFANPESWRATLQAEDLSQPSNLVIISGPSRTADIGMQLVMGAHGPRQVEVLLLD